MVSTGVAMPWSMTTCEDMRTLAGGGCTLGGTMLIGGGSSLVPSSIAANLSGRCCSAVMRYVRPSSSVMLITRNCCITRSGDSVAQIDCATGTALQGAETVTTRVPGLTPLMVRASVFPLGSVARSRSPACMDGGTTSRVRLLAAAALMRPELRRPARVASATWITSPGMQFRASRPTAKLTVSVSRFSL